MYEYSNPLYEPRIHDFGDSYHEEDFKSDDQTESLLVRVKKIRRRYTNWFDYNEACALYDQYMNHLFDKYGGKDQFDLQCLLGKMYDYIPNYPELRKTKKNKYYRKNKVTREMVMSDEVDIQEDFIDRSFDKDECTPDKVVVKVKNDDKAEEVYTGAVGKFGGISVSQISQELDLLDNWFRTRRERIERIKGNKKKKREKIKKLNRRAMKMSLNYRSLTDRINLYDKAKRDKFLGIGPKSHQLIEYKGTVYSSASLEELEVIDSLKSIGVNLNKINLKKLKVIKGKKKKKKDKKRRKKEDKFINEFTGGEYDDFERYQEEMMELTGSRRFD